jgi:integrase/recombinase XerD
VKRGKTTVLVAKQARELLDSNDASTVVGPRDRTLVSVMTFAFVRVVAVVSMLVKDYYQEGKSWSCA